MQGRDYDVVIIGGGAGGIATASSLLKRQRTLDIAVVEPSQQHRYQPGLTLVGGGVFNSAQTLRPMASVMPKAVTWLKQSAAAFVPESDRIRLADGSEVGYRALVVAPGIKLDWQGIEGLADTLGENGVTSNYDPRYAPYTWQLVQAMQSGRAIFTQPPMPIKCAGAPQKAVYLSCCEWERNKRLDDIQVSFHNSGGVLFGVPDYVPALQGYMDRYGVDVNFNETLVAVDGGAQKAWFDVDGEASQKEVSFDMLHVCPPQCAPDFVRDSALANAAGWVDVDEATLQHARFDNVFSLGDVCSAPNAKTAAAVRKQAPVVAENVLAALAGKPLEAIYDGYGSCPLTVERGKVVLAEFGYGGVLQPSAPKWLLDGTKPSTLAWSLKATWLPPIYFDLMLKGREWLARPQHGAGAQQPVGAGS